MPELPDLTVYLESLESRIAAAGCCGSSSAQSVLSAHRRAAARQRRGPQGAGLRRIGKRIVFELEGELYLVLHLMIAGRLQLV